MKVTFVSNYINHHQIPFCNEMYRVLGIDYVFVQTEPMDEERILLGWDSEAVLPYVRYAYKEEEVCRNLIMESDIVIWGGAEDETMLKPRLEMGKPVFRYSERLYKTGQWKAISPRGLRKKYEDHTQYRDKNVYLLCAGAYVASDYHIIRAYPGKMYKWGYFPEYKEYDLQQLMEGKRLGGKKEILWAARFIDWKHPELVVELAEILAKTRSDFHISMIGAGDMKDSVERMLHEKQLEEYVSLKGAIKPEEVRAAMEKAAIFLMTSDRQEGWGAVMNEAMNSGCAVIANRLEGAAPYLIEHGVNGFLYKKIKVTALAEYVNLLLDSKSMCKKIGMAAYATIAEEWNAKVAAERLLQLCQDVAEGKMPCIRWENGPCSIAKIIKEK